MLKPLPDTVLGQLLPPSAGFFVQQYAEYTANERKFHRRQAIADVLAIVLFTGLYLGASWTSDPESCPTAPRMAQSSAMLFAVTTGFVLWQHTAVTPFPTEADPEMFDVMKIIGRWIYLTRHTVALQAIHALATLLVSLGWCPQLCAGVNSSAFFVAGLGLFVTVQFFLLVTPNQDYIGSCRVWAKRGVPFRAIMVFMHVPCGVLSVLDILVIKQRHFLQQHSPTLPWLFGYYLMYNFVYLAILHSNYAATGAWPYGFLKELTSVAKWAKFTTVQFLILVSFVLAAYGMCLVLPVVW